MFQTEDLNKLVKDYEPLINRLTKQYSSKVQASFADVKSMAYEGFALAIQKYDPTKSKLTFTQYAAYAIRNNILTSLDNELRTVKLSNYAQNRAKERGESLFNSVSIDAPVRTGNDDEESSPREMVMNMYEDAKFADGDVFEFMKERITAAFSKRDAEMFFQKFGICGYEEKTGKEIAKEYGLSEGRVSQAVDSVKKYIRKDSELCEMLTNLL